MSDMIEVKAEDLTGSALDWAVAKAEGMGIRLYLCPIDEITRVAAKAAGSRNEDAWLPSLDWGQIGPLIEKYRINIHHYTNDQSCFAEVLGSVERETEYTIPKPRGFTPQIAACRALVQSKLGSVVSIPKELAQ